MNERILSIQNSIDGLSIEILSLRREQEHLAQQVAIMENLFIDLQVAEELFYEEGLKADILPKTEFDKDVDDESIYKSHVNQRIIIISEKIAALENLKKRIVVLRDHEKAHPGKILKTERKNMQVILSPTMSLFEKLRIIIKAENQLQSLPMLVEKLRSLGEDIKQNTEESTTEYKRAVSNIAATLKIYNDRGEIQRCRIKGRSHWFYGLPSWFIDQGPIDEYIPD